MSDAGRWPVHERRVVVLSPFGLHALPAARLVAAAARFRSRITLARPGEAETPVDTVLSVLSLGAGPGTELLLRAAGPDADAAAAAIAALFAGAFGEDGPSGRS